MKRNVFPELEIIVMVLKIKNVLLVVYFAVSRDTYSCKLLRSTRVSASFFLRAFSSLSSLLCVFSASRCSLVKLFTAGKKLHRRLKKNQKTFENESRKLTPNLLPQQTWPETSLSHPAPLHCPLKRRGNQQQVWTNRQKRGLWLGGEHPGDVKLGVKTFAFKLG